MTKTEAIRPTTNTQPDVPTTGRVTGAVAHILRLEGAIAVIVSMLAYQALEESWWVFALLLLVPDLSMLGYLANRKMGALFYNLAHTYLTPSLLALAGFALKENALYGLALIWVAHIGVDRVLGYGLKYQTAFGNTHLSTI